MDALDHAQRRIDHLAHELVHALIIAWRDAQQLAQALDGENLGRTGPYL